MVDETKFGQAKNISFHRKWDNLDKEYVALTFDVQYINMSKLKAFLGTASMKILQ